MKLTPYSYSSKLTFRAALFFCLAFALCLPQIVEAQKKRTANPPVISPWDVEAREYLGTPQSEAAVNRGLAFLAARQQSDGHWASGGYSSDAGITGLAVMGFLAAGHQPGRGKYGLVLSQAVEWLSNAVQMNGQFGPVGIIYGGAGSGQSMYGHGFATLALCEVYGMSGAAHRKDLKPRIEAAVRLIEDSQTVDGQPFRDGGWRYSPMPGDADISVTVAQVLALRAARNAGLKVSQSTIDRAIGYMRRCSNYDSDGGFNYQVGQKQSGLARTGAGVLSLMMAGKKETAECKGGIRFLRQHPLSNRSGGFNYSEHFYYTFYYITQAMYQVGGEDWKAWYPGARDVLVKKQDSDGGWSSNSEAGAEYATAMSVLILQVPAGLLPIYQK